MDTDRILTHDEFEVIREAIADRVELGLYTVEHDDHDDVLVGRLLATLTAADKLVEALAAQECKSPFTQERGAQMDCGECQPCAARNYLTARRGKG